MTSIHNPLAKLNLEKKRVFLRADLNIPLKNGTILQDYRLASLLPTINYIQQHGGKVILATHIGRPKAHSQTDFFDENLSTKHLIPWFNAHGYSIDYEPDLIKAQQKSSMLFTEILLLENLRFFNGEKESRLPFAQLLASLADIYINDAFALIHRDDTSVTLLAEQFPPDKRSIGMLTQREMTELTRLRDNKSSHFMLVLGGCKIEDKIPMLERFIKPSPPQKPIKELFIGGALSRVFLCAQGYSSGAEIFTPATIQQAKHIIALAQHHHSTINLPLDFTYTTEDTPTVSSVCPATAIPEHARCGDIGPETVAYFAKRLTQADLIFCNGPMGIYEDPLFMQGTKGILEAIAKTSAYTVIGGGDTIGAVYLFELEKKFSFLSTGGGATLSFLGCTNPVTDLPALKVFE